MGAEKVKMNEREINLLDLMTEILLHWRRALAVMLVGGVLLGGFSYVQSVRRANAQKALLDQKLPEEGTEDLQDATKPLLEEQLTEVQLNNVNNALMYESLCLEKERYMQDSTWMQMDPMHVQKAELTFLIRSDNMDQTYNIEKVYEDLLTSTELLAYVEEQCKIDGANELIVLEQSSYDQVLGSDTVRMQVRHSDPQICQDMADAVVEFAMEQSRKLQNDIGNHEILLLSSSLGEITDIGLLNRQEEYRTDIASLRNAYINLKAAFSEEEWNYYNYLVDGVASGNPDADKLDQEGTNGGETEENAATEQPIVITTPQVSLKYVVLGVVLFTFVYLLVVFLKYILNNKLRETDSLQEIYEIPQLGKIPAECKKKRFLGAVDQWILKLRYCGERRFTPEESVSLAAVAVKMAAKKQGMSQICLLGCDLEEQTLQVCKQIQEILAKEKIEVKVLNNILYDAEAMEELEQEQGSVLIEKAGSALYEEILRELQLLNRQQVKVLGGIVVE